MSFKKLLIGAAAVLSLAACSKSNDNKTGAAAVSAPALTDNQGNVGTYNAGTPNYTFSVDSSSLMVDGVAIKSIDDKTFDGYPTLASQVSSLQTVNKVISTKENSLELWANDSLLLAFDLRSGTPTLVHSSSGNFQISSATFTMNAADTQGQKQGLSSADLAINMQECMVEQKQEQGKQEQGKEVAPEQKQDQGKQVAPEQKQDQGKQAAPEQKQDQGKKSSVAELTGTQGQEQGKEQPKEQPKQEEKAPQQCKNVTMSFHLSEIAQPKQEQGKQEQGKEEGKQDQGKQDQGKQAPIDQGKQDQGKQDQGKQAPIDQGKQDQGKQDQGKQVAPDQGKQAAPDQGKQAAPEEKGKQDQGKQAAPEEKGKQDQGKQAPIDQGKQDQGKQSDQGKKV